MSKQKVLVVDDEPIVCLSVEKVLRRKGYEIEQTLTVSAALEILEGGKKFDLIIADLMMPQAGGLDLLKALRGGWPEVPVLIITGFASIPSAVEATRLGATGYLPKPFTPEELEKAVEDVASRGPWKAKGGQTSDQIDVDIPFSASEVESATSASYVEHLTRSDVTVAQAAAPMVAADFCSLGQRNCKRFLKKGVCQQEECPLVVAEKKKEGRAAVATAHVFDPIDVDMPFSASEVAALTSEAYVAALGPGDMPIVGHWGQFAPTTSVPKVLVVDDEAVVVNSVRKTLARKGYNVEAAYNCKDALAQIFDRSYDLVLLDMKMSDGNGLDLLPKIKQQRPNLRVVIVTGYASVDTAVEAIQKGANDYMPKPFTPDELYAVTDKVLKTAAA
jgi:DNA-binding NtrC family response regulator